MTTVVKNLQKFSGRIVIVAAVAIAMSACSTYTCPTYASAKSGKGKKIEATPSRKPM